MLLNSGTAESIWGEFYSGTGANIALNLGGAGNCKVNIDTRFGSFSVGDIANATNQTKIVLDDAVPSITTNVAGINQNNCN